MTRDYERDGALAAEEAELGAPGGPYELEYRLNAFLHGCPGWVVVYGPTRAYAGGPFEAVETAAKAAERLNEIAR